MDHPLHEAMHAILISANKLSTATATYSEPEQAVLPSREHMSQAYQYLLPEAVDQCPALEAVGVPSTLAVQLARLCRNAEMALHEGIRLALQPNPDSLIHNSSACSQLWSSLPEAAVALRRLNERLVTRMRDRLLSKAKEWVDRERGGGRGITEEASRILEAAYQCRQNYLNPTEKALIARYADITERQVLVWFQNRRQRGRPRSQGEPKDPRNQAGSGDDEDSRPGPTTKEDQGARYLFASWQESWACTSSRKRTRPVENHDADEPGSKRSRRFGTNTSVEHQRFESLPAFIPPSTYTSGTCSSELDEAVETSQTPASGVEGYTRVPAGPSLRARVASLAVSDNSSGSEKTLWDDLDSDTSVEEQGAAIGGDTTGVTSPSESREGDQNSLTTVPHTPGDQAHRDAWQYIRATVQEPSRSSEEPQFVYPVDFPLEVFDQNLDAALAEGFPNVAPDDFEHIFDQYIQDVPNPEVLAAQSNPSDEPSSLETHFLDADTAFFNTLFGIGHHQQDAILQNHSYAFRPAPETPEVWLPSPTSASDSAPPSLEDQGSPAATSMSLGLRHGGAASDWEHHLLRSGDLGPALSEDGATFRHLDHPLESSQVISAAPANHRHESEISEDAVQLNPQPEPLVSQALAPREDIVSTPIRAGSKPSNTMTPPDPDATRNGSSCSNAASSNASSEGATRSPSDPQEDPENAGIPIPIPTTSLAPHHRHIHLATSISQYVPSWLRNLLN